MRDGLIGEELGSASREKGRVPPGCQGLEPVRDKRAFKQLVQAMNVAQRDSGGGGIVERFDVVSKVLFTKVFDEREVEQAAKDRYEFQIEPGDTIDSVWRRVTGLWHRACSRHESLYQGRIPELTGDKRALHRMVEILKNVSLLRTPGDIKGIAYEELLRNTFDKNENQQFFTPHEVVEFMVKMTAPGENDMICDPACGTGGFLVEALRVSRNAVNLVGAEVDERLVRVAQMNLIMHGADRGGVRYLSGAGSLAPLEQIAWALSENSFDLILTNPPFGSDLSDEVALRGYEVGRGRTSRRRSVLFTERCLDLLRPGGRMAIVLDDSVLNLPSNSDVRSMIMSRAVVEAVVSLPDVAFMPYSTAKSSILFLRRKAGTERQGLIFMAEGAEVGRRANGDPLYSDERDEQGNRLLLSDLPGIADAYMAFRESGKVAHHRCFLTRPSLLDDRLDIYYYHPKRFAAEEEIGCSSWPTPALTGLVVPRRDSVTPCEEFGDSPVRWLGLGDIEEGTGQFDIKIVPGDKIKSPSSVFRGGDILFSRLRPNLRKVVLVPDEDEGGVCSGEISVLRALDKLPHDHLGRLRGNLEPGVNSEYLAFMLRSDLVYGQLIYKITGVGRPRVSAETVLSVRVPLPPLEEQRRMVSIFKAASADSIAARREASLWMERARNVISQAYEKVIGELTLGVPISK